MILGLYIVLVIIAVYAGWTVWQSRRGKTPAAAISTESIAPEVLAQQTFIRGNTHLFNGEVEEAIAAFQRALELNPHHPHAAKRLAEAEQRRTVQGKTATIAA